MEQSILKSTKKILGLEASYTVFDPDICTFINTAMSSLAQIGVGPIDGFFIEDDTAIWQDLDLPAKQLAMVKAYIYLKVKSMFDPPSTSFHIKAVEDQIDELETRLNIFREEEIRGG